LQAVLEDLESGGALVIREKALHHPSPPKKMKKGWVPWVDVQSFRRQCHFHCDMGRSEGGLERIEAAWCGSLIVVPEREPPLRVLQPLAYKMWKDEDELRRILTSHTEPRVIANQAKQQTWRKVAERIIKELERR